MLQTTIKFLLRLLGALCFALTILFGLSCFILLAARQATRKRIYSVTAVTRQPTAIVFGAGLHRDGTPTTVLRDRIATAAHLFFNGKAENLLMSGDGQGKHYNEPDAMRAYAIKLGVPAKNILRDNLGRRTYDTCYRAKHVFGLSKVIVVTQSYHLPRTLIICNHLALEAAGVPADRRRYWPLTYLLWNLREIPATINALIDIWVAKPIPPLDKSESSYRAKV